MSTAAVESYSRVARPRSEAAFAAASDRMPGGVNSPARAFGAVGGTPIFFERGQGQYLYDLDGHRYLDLVGSWGPLIFGHAHPKIIEAVETTVMGGTTFGAPTLRETALAEQIAELWTSIEMVRLVNSGTEATMSALRLARGFTGRAKIIKFAGNYHGHADSLLVAAGSAAATLAVPNSPGVPAGVAADTLVLPYNDATALRQCLAEHGDEIAAAIFEPVCGNMGVVLPGEEFLQVLDQDLRTAGALLICDEVMTGFRVGLGGAQTRLGITPDITTLGKILGGGLPLGAYGGRREVMQHVLPAGKVFQAGTLSGNPVATAAGLATLKLLQEASPYDRLEELGSALAEGLIQAAQVAGVPAQLARMGSMLTLFFSEQPVVDWETAAKCDTNRFAQFFWGMADRGVYLPCSQYEAMFLPAVMSDADLDQTLQAAGEVLAAIAG